MYDRAKSKVRNKSLEFTRRKIEILKEMFFRISTHKVDFQVVREMQEDICEFDVSMDNTQIPYIATTIHDLSQYL
jgi:hypothetical protein